MKPWERWLFRLAILLATLTGGLYGWTKFFGERLGEFGPEPHPWQGTLQHLHVLLVPPLVFMAGWMVRGHGLASAIEGKRARRLSGLALLIFIAPMVLSGYLLQTSVAPVWQKLWSWSHMGFAGLFGLGTVLHMVTRKTARGELPENGRSSVSDLEGGLSDQ